MKRFTFKKENGDWGLNNYNIKEVPSELYGALYKLKEYEETGLTPDQIYQINELYSEQAKELMEYRKSNRWIPCSERLPETDGYILLSFENFTLPDIGRYEEDKEGGAFYPGDEERSYASYGLFVNAWKPLPEPYKTKGE